MTALWLLLLASVVVGLVVGILAKLPPRQLVAEVVVMCLLALTYYGLVALGGVSQGG
jgi:uncharacterized membrane protein YjjB (DUF3815 family)